MEIDGIDCVSTSDGIYEEEIHHQHRHRLQFSASLAKPTNNAVSPAISPATSVHELLECSVCTNSMYPPIHQVCSVFLVYKVKKVLIFSVGVKIFFFFGGDLGIQGLLYWISL